MVILSPRVQFYFSYPVLPTERDNTMSESRIKSFKNKGRDMTVSQLVYCVCVCVCVVCSVQLR